MIDYDGDGCMDAWMCTLRMARNGQRCGRRGRNIGTGSTQRLKHGHFTDVTEKAGAAGEGFSVAMADYDHDGKPDIFVAGLNRNLLYRNHSNGTFEERAVAAGLMPKRSKPWAISAGFFDMDNDGWPVGRTESRVREFSRQAEDSQSRVGFAWSPTGQCEVMALVTTQGCS